MPAVPRNRVKSPAEARRRTVAKAAETAKAVEVAAEAATKTPACYVLLAETLPLGGGTAEHEWGWKRTKTGWTDVDGNAVSFVADLTELKALCKKSKGPVAIYEGYRWYAAVAPHLLGQLVDVGLVVRMPHPAPHAPV